MADILRMWDSGENRTKPPGMDRILRRIVHGSHVGIFLINSRYECIYANPEIARIVNRPVKALVGCDFRQYLPRESIEAIEDFHRRRQRGQPPRHRYEADFIPAGGGERRTAEIRVDLARTLCVEPVTIVQVFDITDRTRELNALNMALDVLLKKREKDRKKFQDRIAHSIKEVLIPCMALLKDTALDRYQRVYLNMLENNFMEMATPFLSHMPDGSRKLTPTEIQVVNLIKQDKISKEIADILGVSHRTVESHRNNIRKKLGIKNRKINLRSFLLDQGPTQSAWDGAAKAPGKR